ncbi:MAG: 50S ribosomal protein L23 [Deltaproteobacteria bacterium]|nr:MAG: 50S ribosomal protein L23 [Deltaproteobacteria bacterium]HEX15641.1 50S ribosomal protein L23 [Deltaproteobacteria bacterium]
MRDPYSVIIRPVITEKATLQKERDNKVTFQVAKDANKAEIKEAVEKLFNVKVEKVNVMNVRGKRRRLGRIVGKKPDWKKAIVTLKPGYSIDFFEGA